MGANHKVQEGECISSIAFDYGFFPETIWNDSNNAELKEKRKSPNVLLPGDIVYVPDKREKEEDIDAEQRHQFRRKGVPEIFKLQLLDENDKPRSGVQYKLVVDGKELTGTTDGSGRLQQRISPNAQKAELLIDPHERYELKLGRLEPVDSEKGVRVRLVNIGFLSEVNAPRADYKSALEQFQKTYSLTMTGEPDEATRNKLLEEHGC